MGASHQGDAAFPELQSHLIAAQVNLVRFYNHVQDMLLNGLGQGRT